MRRFSTWMLAAVLTGLLVPAATAAMGDADVAALQVGLKARGFYAGAVDGSLGPVTADAVRRFQARKGLAVNGVAGRGTRLALGHYGRVGPLGRRLLYAGTTGWDVASLQFLLAWHGFPSGEFDGHFSARTDSALRLFQRWAGLGADGLAGRATVAALRRSPPSSPIALSPPSANAPTEGFGPRGRRFHAGLDFPGAVGAPVRAAGRGTVTHVGPMPGGWGKLVVIDHAAGVQTWYAHLSSTRVRTGSRVDTGTLVGGIGATGRATGPHLHFEVRVRGAAIAPWPALY